jgi:HEAT repeat protein
VTLGETAGKAVAVLVQQGLLLGVGGLTGRLKVSGVGGADSDEASTTSPQHGSVSDDPKDDDDDASCSTRARAAIALRMMGPVSRPALGALTAALRSDTNLTVRKHAAWALGSIGSSAAESPSEDGTGKRDLGTCTASRQAGQEGGGGVGNGCNTAVCQALADALQGDTEAEVRRNAAHGLGLLYACRSERQQGKKDKSQTQPPGCSNTAHHDRFPLALSHLIAALSDGDAGVRRHAAQALGGMGPAASPAATQLGKTLQDPNGDVRRNAALAMNSIGARAGSGHASSSAGGDGGAGVSERLVGALSDSSYKVRRNAVQALGKLGAGAGPDVVVPLCGLLQSDGHIDVRKRSADALGLVLSGLRGTTGSTEGAAATADKAGLNALAATLSSHADSDVRRLSALALARVGACAGGLASDVVGVLKEVCENDDCPKVRGLARQTVDKLRH